MAELPDDAIVAAAKAIMADRGHAEWKWDELLAGTKLVFRHHAEVALRAAYPLIAARVRAEAVSDERQRIADEIKAEMLAVNGRYQGTTAAALGYLGGLDKASVIAAGSVPVASRRTGG